MPPFYPWRVPSARRETRRIDGVLVLQGLEEIANERGGSLVHHGRSRVR